MEFSFTWFHFSVFICWQIYMFLFGRALFPIDCFNHILGLHLIISILIYFKYMKISSADEVAVCHWQSGSKLEKREKLNGRIFHACILVFSVCVCSLHSVSNHISVHEHSYYYVRSRGSMKIYLCFRYSDFRSTAEKSAHTPWLRSWILSDSNMLVIAYLFNLVYFLPLLEANSYNSNNNNHTAHSTTYICSTFSFPRSSFDYIRHKIQMIIHTHPYTHTYSPWN